MDTSPLAIHHHRTGLAPQAASQKPMPLLASSGCVEKSSACKALTLRSQSGSKNAPSIQRFWHPWPKFNTALSRYSASTTRRSHQCGYTVKPRRHCKIKLERFGISAGHHLSAQTVTLPPQRSDGRDVIHPTHFPATSDWHRPASTCPPPRNRQAPAPNSQRPETAHLRSSQGNARSLAPSRPAYRPECSTVVSLRRARARSSRRTEFVYRTAVGPSMPYRPQRPESKYHFVRPFGRVRALARATCTSACPKSRLRA